MRFPLIKVRLLQFKRILFSVGIIYVVLIFIALLSALYFAFNGYGKMNSAFKISASLLGTVFFIHISRKDLQFIQRHVQHPIQNIFMEYLVFTFPFTSLCLLTKQWFFFPVMLLFSYSTQPFKIINAYNF